MNLLRRLFSSAQKAGQNSFGAEIAPEKPFVVIGDIHGHDRLLSGLLDNLGDREDTKDLPIVFVGDYIDRGEQSADVLMRLFGLCSPVDSRVVCLAGNHEDMMLKFINDPAERGARWLKFGGLQTLASFGIGGVTIGSSGAALEDARDKLVDAMGENLLKWLETLPTHWQSGNVAVVHAGADPAVPISEQSPRTLKWGHKDFGQLLRRDGIWIVHGHTIVDTPRYENGRISIDTGAYATGKLTAAIIKPESVEFLQA